MEIKIKDSSLEETVKKIIAEELQKYIPNDYLSQCNKEYSDANVSFNNHIQGTYTEFEKEYYCFVQNNYNKFVDSYSELFGSARNSLSQKFNTFCDDTEPYPVVHNKVIDIYKNLFSGENSDINNYVTCLKDVAGKSGKSVSFGDYTTDVSNYDQIKVPDWINLKVPDYSFQASNYYVQFNPSYYKS